MTSARMTAALTMLVAIAREEYGETQWRYEKKRISWIRSGRNSCDYYHTTPVGPGKEVSKDEYDANLAESNCCVIEAFKGKLPRSYDRYERIIANPGWREHLMETIKNMECET